MLPHSSPRLSTANKFPRHAPGTGRGEGTIFYIIPSKCVQNIRVNRSYGFQTNCAKDAWCIRLWNIHDIGVKRTLFTLKSWCSKLIRVVSQDASTSVVVPTFALVIYVATLSVNGTYSIDWKHKITTKRAHFTGTLNPTFLLLIKI